MAEDLAGAPWEDDLWAVLLDAAGRVSSATSSCIALRTQNEAYAQNGVPRPGSKRAGPTCGVPRSISD